MDALNDDCLRLILIHLNLNERTTCRLVNKRFTSLCDSIRLNDKLVIFIRCPPIPGKLMFTNERYGLNDTVYVTDLEHFFNQHAEVLENLQKLVILGMDQ